MQAVKITIITIMVFFSNSLASAQSSNENYQNLWYGYNQFTETPTQKELRITCGDLSENKYKVFDRIFADYKLVKFNNQLRFMMQADKRNKFVATPANLEETKVSTSYTFGFRKNVPYKFWDLSLYDKQRVAKAFERFVPDAGKDTIWQALDAISPLTGYEWDLKEEWEKYFKILNVHDDYLLLNLEEGTLSRLGGGEKIKLLVATLTLNLWPRYGTNQYYFFPFRL